MIFATNWKAQAAHGGFYQALADGTYRKYGLDVTIRQGGPQVNNRPLLPAGRIDFLMTGNLLHTFDNVKNGVPTVVVAAMFQKDPQALIAHPGQGYEKFDGAEERAGRAGRQGRAVHLVAVAEGSARLPRRAAAALQLQPRPLPREPEARSSRATPSPSRSTCEKQGGFKPVVHLLADHGFSTYSHADRDADRDRAEASPDLVQRFVDASIVGWVNYLYGDRTAANALMIEGQPGDDESRRSRRRSR